jgi:redox-sensitive bicupin YhaK (pirin superfamily)
VNWMTAGRGIVHSERTPAELRTEDKPLFGIQAWIALPVEDEETAPAFSHHAAESLPSFEDQGLRMRLIAGEFQGERSPVPTFSGTLYADVQLETGARLHLDALHEERALYLVSGEIELAKADWREGRFEAVPGDDEFIPLPDIPGP